jgi:hypothetical protein
MSTNKTSFHHYYYRIAPPIISSKFLSKSSDSLTNIDRKNECQEKQKQANKTSKMKKSQTTITAFETKPVQTSFNSPSLLRRRFSLFRIKRSPQSNENSNVQVLHQTIDQLRRDLQTKTNELELQKDQRETKQHESIEQAMHLQTILNSKLEEMITENDSLKKSIQELESFAEQQKSKTKT